MVSKTIEYEDAPSGQIKLYNYKEPLMRVEEGYGFLGVLALDPVKDLIQCHTCGEWHKSLQNHLRYKHQTNVASYKREYGLLSSTALINEEMRAIFSAHGENNLEVYRKNFQENSHKHSEETKAKIKETLKQNRMENRNLKGTCPEQLIDRLQKLAFDLGRTPKQIEVPFEETLVKVYGTFKNALEIAGLPYRKPGVNVKTHKYNLQQCVDGVRKFVDKNGKYPRYVDFKKTKEVTMWKSIIRYGKAKIFSEAIIAKKYIHIPNNHRIKYDKNSLTKILLDFKEHNGREPMTTDIKRKLLPRYGTFKKHFGGWLQAKEEVFGVK